MNRMGHRFNKKYNAGFKRQGTGFPVGPTCASTAVDKRSNLNCDYKLFHLH
jgi:hypothetical protein